MNILDDLLSCEIYKAVYIYDTKAVYIWRNGECSYFRDLSMEQVDLLKEKTEHARRKFSVNGVAF